MNLCPSLPFVSNRCLSQRLRTQSCRTSCGSLVIAVAAALTPGCIQAKAEVPEVEITRQNIQVPATPAAVPDGTIVTLKKQFQYDQAPVSLPDNVTLEVRATELAFAKAMADRNFDAFVAHLSRDAVFFDERAVLHGADEVALTWNLLFKSPKAPFSWAPDDVEVLASGNLALSTGPVVVDGKVVGRFNSIWRLESPRVKRRPCKCSTEGTLH